MQSRALLVVTALSLVACVRDDDAEVASSYAAIETYAGRAQVAVRVTQTSLEANPAAPDTATKLGAYYTGMTTAAGKTFAADYTHGRVDVFDAAQKRTTVAGGFVDPRLPPHYAPFNIQALDDKLFVAYGTDDVLGGGIIDAFDTDGSFLDRIAEGGSLDAPWGIALAPNGFGPASGALLVGNVGSGEIHAFVLKSGREIGVLADAQGKPLRLAGLTAIAFHGPTLFFTAGLTHGSLEVRSP